MAKENKPSKDSDPSEQELSSEEGKEDVGNGTDKPEWLSEVEEVSGREFKDTDDFKKHYKNLNSTVGDQKVQELKKKAESFDKLQEEADKFTDKEPNEKEESSSGEIDQLKERFNRSEFLRENPDAKKHVDLVEAVANQEGVSRKEAWEDQVEEYASSVEAKRKEKSDMTKPQSRLGKQDRKRINDLANKAKEGNDDAKEALVSEVLGLSK